MQRTPSRVAHMMLLVCTAVALAIWLGWGWLLRLQGRHARLMACRQTGRGLPGSWRACRTSRLRRWRCGGSAATCPRV